MRNWKTLDGANLTFILQEWIYKFLHIINEKRDYYSNGKR